MAYLPLSTANLPDPAIDPAQGSSPADYFNTVLYPGNNSTQSIDVGFATDFTWIKVRNVADNHFLYDSVRGATKYLSSDTTSAEGTIANGLTSFTSTGFNLGDSGSTNNASNNFVAWNWKAGTSFSNDASATSIGTVDSNGSVSTESGFSIVRFNSGASGTQSFKHGLTQRPDLCIFKEKDSGGAGDHWVVWEGVALNPAQSYGYLNLSNSFANDASQWSNTAPTDSVFTYNSGYAWSTSQEMIAYCFHSVEGYSKCSSYVGNNNADGPFVYTGFRPTFVIIKQTSGSNAWVMYDNAREPYNVIDLTLQPHLNSAEIDDPDQLDFVSNGFKIRANDTNARMSNASGGTYIYMAFAENPFKYSNAR